MEQQKREITTSEARQVKEVKYICPSCGNRLSSPVSESSCAYCGYEPGTYARFKTRVHALKSNVGIVGGVEQHFNARHRNKCRRLSRCPLHLQRKFTFVLDFLKVNHESAYNYWELRRYMHDADMDAKNLKKVLQMMTGQGVVNERLVKGTLYYTYVGKMEVPE